MRNKDDFSLSLRIIGFKTENPSDQQHEWTARCLEINISGFGDSQEAALKDLLGLIEVQREYAIEIGDSSILDNPAEACLFDTWSVIMAQEKNQIECQRAEMNGPNLVDSNLFFQRRFEPYQLNSQAV